MDRGHARLHPYARLYGVTARGHRHEARSPASRSTSIPIAAKTGTGEVFGKQTTSWFASFDDRYAVVVMVEQGGTGASTSGPAVRAIYEAIYGLAGQHPLLPNGVPPDALPAIAADGTVAAPS